jgi:ribosome biogenesis GTPase
MGILRDDGELMAKKSRKIRADFRKNRTPRTRLSDWTQKFHQEAFNEESPVFGERIGKGELSRRRTVLTGQAEDAAAGDGLQLEIDQSACRRGRVLSVFGLNSTVEGDDGATHQCATRRLLKTLSTDQRHVVAAGDRVWFRAACGRAASEYEGIIEVIEPRHGVLCRETHGRQHIIATNVDQVLIVASAAEPHLKPNLIDRMLVAAEHSRIRPVICINKIDLVDPADLEPLVGVYAQMGYRVLLVSSITGLGVGRVQRLLKDRASAIAGQSGVGKSSLLNAVQPSLRLVVAPVSVETEKGKHTTTTARLIPLEFGGYVVDTPGVRQFQLWDIVPEEVVNYYRDLRVFVSNCKFPDCTHTHEADCAIKNAVADGRLDDRRYESYLQLHAGEME